MPVFGNFYSFFCLAGRKEDSAKKRKVVPVSFIPMTHSDYNSRS